MELINEDGLTKITENITSSLNSKVEMEKVYSVSDLASIPIKAKRTQYVKKAYMYGCMSLFTLTPNDVKGISVYTVNIDIIRTKFGDTDVIQHSNTLFVYNPDIKFIPDKSGVVDFQISDCHWYTCGLPDSYGSAILTDTNKCFIYLYKTDTFDTDGRVEVLIKPSTGTISSSGYTYIIYIESDCENVIPTTTSNVNEPSNSELLGGYKFC